MVMCLSPIALSQINSSASVKTYGAKGDGQTDDTQAIKKAFAGVSQNGGKVYFPPGVYLTNIIDIRPQKGTSIEITGEPGKSKIVKRSSDPMNIALFFCEVSNVNLDFKNLTLVGSASSKIGKWKTNGKDIDVTESTNGITGWNLASLTVTLCQISDFHGKGIACFSSGKFIANNNVISNVSGSGINGHRVNYMETINNSITNTGFLADTFILDGKQHNKSTFYPAIKFGDGIESESNSFIAKENKIVNPGRCGIVHDLAKDLGYQNSSALVSNNVILMNSDNINNNNPPAGMWFEQSDKVEVVGNKVTLKKSWSKIVSGIRFYDVTSSIVCRNNIIDANGYNHLSDGGIGIYEPESGSVVIEKNTVSGNFIAGVAISYGLHQSKIDNLAISGNQFTTGPKSNATTGIQISIDGKKQFPAVTNISGNTMSASITKPFNLFYYGSQPVGIPKKSTLKMSNNAVNGVIGNKLPKDLPGLKLLSQ